MHNLQTDRYKTTLGRHILCVRAHLPTAHRCGELRTHGVHSLIRRKAEHQIAGRTSHQEFGETLVGKKKEAELLSDSSSSAFLELSTTGFKEKRLHLDGAH